MTTCAQAVGKASCPTNASRAASPASASERSPASTKAVRVAGGGKVTLDPESGRYTIVVASEGMPPDNNTDNPWDEVLTDAAHQKRTA